MNFIKKLFGNDKSQQASKKEEVVFYRGNQPAEISSGTEKQFFIKEVAMVLGREASTINLEARLIQDFDCADLDVGECVQIAEEIWHVQLMPNPMTEADYAQIMNTFPTLQSIIVAAEVKRKL